MEMQQVRYFVALADTLNFTRAAEKCNVSQPALTRAIQQLEHELGGPLFHRERGNTHLSELGRMMFPYLQTVEESARAAREQGENLVLVLGHAEYYPRFGFTPASGFGIRPPFEVEDKYMMALALDPARPVPTGTIRYPAAFGV